MTGGSELLFVYGTLRFPEVLEALLGRVPEHSPAEAAGWRAAALQEHVFPGLVPAASTTVRGVLLLGLTAEDRRRLDAFEGDAYALRSITLADGRQARAYVWLGEVLPEDWDADTFAHRDLAAYTARLRT
ncbi:gamma-glutamylcyclotransferase [Streptomyces sp. N2-109]|uniref:Putative gamma-glutamylcyclotransferase n=1 Tax=Streptomyces gossypii TaxID=2883101 RepID=A0ABT2K098_9ACTN|nr:gamma-glutamylcyclotransferase family protein [Streptomyces gossypii]MCT2593592.1 gamma-glutamylcyclotransferase [Streptomyces gossypii]